MRTAAVCVWAPLLLLAPRMAWPAPGTRSPEFLRVGLGARPVALAESYAALADDVYAIAYNPAGLAFLNRQEFAFMHNFYLSGVFQEYAAYAYPSERLGCIALSANQLRVSPFAAYDVNDQPTGQVSANDLALGGAYALRRGGLAAGVSGKYLRSRLAETKASATSWDAGLLWRLPHGLRLGISAANMGRGLRYERETAPLPSTTRVGGGWMGPFIWPGVRLATSLQGNFQPDRTAFFSGGLEVGLAPFVALRVGHRNDQPDPVPVSWGAGFEIPLSRGPLGPTTWSTKITAPDKVPMQLRLDYAFVRLGDIGITHRVSVMLRFGSIRELVPRSPIQD